MTRPMKKGVMTMLAARRLALALLLLVCAPRLAEAALASCSVSATNVAFGYYDPTSAANNDSTGTVTVSCSLVLGISLLVAYNISLSTGGGSYAQRQMTANVTSKMNYNLYTPSGFGTVWGDGAGGTGIVSDFYLLGLGGATTPYTVNGRIPGSQLVPAGSYSDNIVVTVTY